MIIKTNNRLTIEVCFDPLDREEGYEDDIRFSIMESGPKHTKIFKVDRTSFLLTPDQAEKLALALKTAAEQSRNKSKKI